MTPAPGPGRSDLGRVDSKIRARRWPRPVLNPEDQPERRSLRYRLGCGVGASVDGESTITP
ncbi:hypothetical protein G7045_08015 [Acidovorax sp. HDW3]|uniref:hypothetical protein n=1 Tax=Acidovorax sp. HDW3 TaxID=2714923 RepID=UPI00140A0436|nr:hypothetical protein [Acidovorax sp. HDW3]QIL44210.1 hypothetical protein G7045_08015 [Acidovorax sp. HDW3]